MSTGVIRRNVNRNVIVIVQLLLSHTSDVDTLTNESPATRPTSDSRSRAVYEEGIMNGTVNERDR